LSDAAAWAARHARVVIAIAAVLAAAAAVLATQLSTDAGEGTLVDSDTEAYRATQGVHRAFGSDPVVVLAEGDLQRLVLTANLGRLLRLEGCLSGRVPAGAKPIPGPCAELARMRPVELLSGPATFLNEAVIQVDRQLRRLAARVPPDQLRQLLLEVAARYGITSVPSLDNPEFLAAVVFDLRRERGTPKARLAYLFPNGRAAQIVLRLRDDLSEAERRRALELIRAAVLDPTPRQACIFRGEPEACFALRGGSYTISGAPVVVDALKDALTEELLVLLAVAIVVMALVLLAVFRSRLRLLPLAIALGAAALTFGLLHLTGGSLTIASIAVLPILIGLVVDYAIQLQARFDEAIAEGLDRSAAVRQAASRGGPTIGIACLATAAGFLALQLSPTPMVRGFGLLLVVGIAIGFGLALTAGLAVLSLRREDNGAFPDRGIKAPWVLETVVSYPRRVLGIGLALAAVGWAASTQVGTVSDIRELAPQRVSAVKDLDHLQETTGVSGELDVSVEAPDLTDPATLRWMAEFKERVLDSNGFSGPNPSCMDAEVCPGPALSDFVDAGGEGLTRREVRATFAALPAYDLRHVAEIDPETGMPDGTALLSFGIRAQGLEEQQELIERVESEIGEPGSSGGPPAGVEVRLAGLPVIGAAAASDLSGSRYRLTLAGLLAVALVLLVAYRSASRALAPLAPIALATGWAALLLWISGIPLNPMSAALGALTIAIATEFSVILTARFHEERRAGRDVGEALRRAYARTGAAVLASAITVIAGFAVLVLSDVRMLRDFGLVTVVDLTVALLGVMIALPAVLAWAEER
jgi:predicted RND superfamily exporter protein